MTSVETRLDRLESLVDKQQAQIERYQETIDSQQELIDQQRQRLETMAEDDAGSASPPISRRRAIQAGSALGLLGLGAGTASAAGSGQVGTTETPVNTIYTETLDGGLTGGTAIDDLTGSGLEIYGTSPTRSLRVNWDDATGLNGSGIADQLSATGELSMSVTNDTEAGNIVAGYSLNAVDTNFGGVIAGGGTSSDPNEIGTGADYATISGGRGNTASGTFATIPGGENISATGDYSFAFGNEVDAQDNGAFVVGDSSATPISSTRADQARFQMNVGADAFELLTQRGEPTTTELGSGEGMLYIDDGNTNNAGDLVYSYNDSGSIVTVVAAPYPV